MTELCKELPNFYPRDKLPVYIEQFEQNARERDVPKQHWVRALRNLLSGDILSTWVELAQNAEEPDYDILKAHLLDRQGFDWIEFSKFMQTFPKPSHISWDAYASELRLRIKKIVGQADTVDRAIEWCTKAMLINLVHSYKRFEVAQKNGESLSILIKQIEDWDKYSTHRNRSRDFRVDRSISLGTGMMVTNTTMTNRWARRNSTLPNPSLSLLVLSVGRRDI